VSFNIPIINTESPHDTAEILVAIAKREQLNDESEFSLRTERKPLTMSEQQEYIVESLPSVGPHLAKALLLKFGSVKNVFDASIEQLKDVEGIGEKKAAEIKRVIEEKYANQSL